MRVRFLQTTPSSNPAFPFQAGQIIQVERLTPELRGWIKASHAEVLREVDEAAMLEPAGERATLPAAAGRR